MIMLFCSRCCGFLLVCICCVIFVGDCSGRFISVVVGVVMVVFSRVLNVWIYLVMVFVWNRLVLYFSCVENVLLCWIMFNVRLNLVIVCGLCIGFMCSVVFLGGGLVGLVLVFRLNMIWNSGVWFGFWFIWSVFIICLKGIFWLVCVLVMVWMVWCSMVLNGLCMFSVKCSVWVLMK